ADQDQPAAVGGAERGAVVLAPAPAGQQPVEGGIAGHDRRGKRLGAGAADALTLLLVGEDEDRRDEYAVPEEGFPGEAEHAGCGGGRGGSRWASRIRVSGLASLLYPARWDTASRGAF